MTPRAAALDAPGRLRRVHRRDRGRAAAIEGTRRRGGRPDPVRAGARRLRARASRTRRRRIAGGRGLVDLAVARLRGRRRPGDRGAGGGGLSDSWRAARALPVAGAHQGPAPGGFASRRRPPARPRRPAARAAIAAASSGCCSASAVTAPTARSSPTLATMLVNGSGEALIPSRRLALTPWLASASAPVPPPASAWSKLENPSAAGELDPDRRRRSAAGRTSGRRPRRCRRAAPCRRRTRPRT